MSDSKSQFSERRTLLILYVLAMYILFQLFWWGYHLIQLNKEVLELKTIVLGQSQYAILVSKIWMVVGEGSVFFLLLALGFWYIKRTVVRELRLAQMEKTFLLSVTHELKTPIAAVKLQLETLKSRQLSAEQTSKLIDDALRETRRLQSLSENILLATRLDQKNGALLKEKFDFSSIVKHEVQRYRSMSQVTFTEQISEQVIFYGDEQMITALVSNLLENAVKYADTGPVIVKLRSHQDDLVLEVADSGIGIPEEEKLKVFGKFYRIGNEETRTTKGTGLGLFICANIVRLHYGRISVRNNLPNGSIFVVTFPNKTI